MIAPAFKSLQSLSIKRF